MSTGDSMDGSLVGRLLVASPLLADPNFVRSVVLILQHGEDGAVGVILNRPSESAVGAHLPEWAEVVCEPMVVFVGGPCEAAVAIGLLLEPEPVRTTGVPGVGIADLEQPPTGEGARIYSGYSGWGPGQLEDELAEQAWMVVDAEPADVFTADPEGLWSRVLKRQPDRRRLLATFPTDPSLN